MSALCTSGNQSNDYVQFQYFFEKLTQAYICDRVKSSYTSSLFISPKKQKKQKNNAQRICPLICQHHCKNFSPMENQT